MHSEQSNVADICSRLVEAGAFPDTTSFWLGFLTYAYRNGATADMIQVHTALVWIEAGGLAEIEAPQTKWFYDDFCRLGAIVEAAQSYLHFRELDRLFAGPATTV